MKRECTTHDPLQECHLVLRFRQAFTSYEALVARIVGDPVHVDIFLHRKKKSRDFAQSPLYESAYHASNPTSMNNMSFSAFVGEKFSMTTMTEEIISSSHMNISIPVNQQEMERMEKFVISMVGVVPYNYSDIALLMGFVQNSGFTDTMFPDVPVDQQNAPSTLTSVFCSQAVVLMLRSCLDQNGMSGALAKILHAVNSRTISPAKLYHMVARHGFKVAAHSILEDEIIEMDGVRSPW